ncbi:MAG: DUF1287 domain-containing protein [Candidatus Sumerlaeaceae bacterium]|nr:DUF1287 domain-containing protein [Candidatus Sumerlaeaceae bacterium]
MKQYVVGLLIIAIGLSHAWSATLAVNQSALVASAKSQIGITLTYDPEYRDLKYPGGDVPLSTGVCTDVVIRALRDQGIDLQKEVHLDMKANFERYPRIWGLKQTDASIDHRRVPNLMTFLKRQGCVVKITDVPADYRPGDIVTWDLANGSLPHIGVISDRQSPDGNPLVIHNIGRGTQEEDTLFKYRIIGHYRLPPRTRIPKATTAQPGP